MCQLVSTKQTATLSHFQKALELTRPKDFQLTYDASQCKQYLGFSIDTDSMTVRISEAKKQQITQQVLETIAHGPKPILAKELAGTLG